MVVANFNHRQDALWFPILVGLGFDNPELTESWDDQETATDIIAGNRRLVYVAGIRARYNQSDLEQYYREFTIRFSRPTGTPTEWEKLFGEGGGIIPDYLAYGWVNHQRQFLNWMIIDVPTLREAHGAGLLDQFGGDIRRNSDYRRSELIPISVPRLIDGQSSEFVHRLFPFYSENHPAFA